MYSLALAGFTFTLTNVNYWFTDFLITSFKGQITEWILYVAFLGILVLCPLLGGFIGQFTTPKEKAASEARLNLQAFLLSLISLLFPFLSADLWLALVLFSLFNLLLGAILPTLTISVLRSVPSASTTLACAYSLALVLIFGQLPSTLVVVSPYSFTASVLASALIFLANATSSPEQDRLTESTKN